MIATATPHDPAPPAAIADTGKIRLGAGIGLLPPAAPPAELRDPERIRLGAGFGLLPPVAH